MTPIAQAREFVIQSVFDPVLNATGIDKKIQDIAKNRKIWIEHFTRVGDLSLYLNRFNDPGETDTYKTLRAHDLKGFEDILPEFNRRFATWKDDITTPDSFVVGRAATAYEI